MNGTGMNGNQDEERGRLGFAHINNSRFRNAIAKLAYLRCTYLQQASDWGTYSKYELICD